MCVIACVNMLIDVVLPRLQGLYLLVAGMGGLLHADRIADDLGGR